MKSLINLTDLSALSVTGEDAATLLQGQITCDVNEMSENRGQFGAFCNTKGRVIATFVMAKIQDGFLLVLPKKMLTTVNELLERYKLRSKVEFFVLDDLPIENFLKSTTLRTPWILPETSEQFMPHALKLEMIRGAISLTKGCYTGQEVIVRTHYLGEIKRQLTLAVCDPAIADPFCGIIDESGEQVGNVLLAQVRGLPYKTKDEITGEVVEKTTVNKSVVLCIVNTETDSALRLDNSTRETLKIIGGSKNE